MFYHPHDALPLDGTKAFSKGMLEPGAFRDEDSVIEFVVVGRNHNDVVGVIVEKFQKTVEDGDEGYSNGKGLFRADSVNIGGTVGNDKSVWFCDELLRCRRNAPSHLLPGHRNEPRPGHYLFWTRRIRIRPKGHPRRLGVEGNEHFRWNLMVGYTTRMFFLLVSGWKGGFNSF